MVKIRSIDTLPLDGGALCFHFINTVYAWRGDNLHEYLGAYEDVIQWCARVEILTPVKRKRLLEFSKQHPLKANNAMRQIRKTREMLYHFFSIVAADIDGRMPANVIADFNAALSQALTHLQFYITRREVKLGWKDMDADLLEPVWIVMKSAYDILTAEDRFRIKECSQCGWIFVDHTKNNKRRWCNPVTCGSTEKSRKYYRKKKQEQKIKTGNPRY